MKTVLISSILLISSWTYSQKNNFYSSENIDSLLSVLELDHKNDINKAYCLDQIVRYYTNNEDYKKAGEYLVHYESLGAKLNNPDALERSKYRRAIWTYHSSDEKYLDSTALIQAYDYFLKNGQTGFCSGIASILCWHFDGYNGENRGYKKNANTSTTVKWYTLHAEYALKDRDYDQAAAAYCNSSIRLTKDDRFDEAEKYSVKAEKADDLSTTHRWSENIMRSFIDLYSASHDNENLLGYEERLKSKNDPERLLNFYEWMWYEEMESMEMHQRGAWQLNPGPWTVKRDKLWKELNPKEAETKEAEAKADEQRTREEYETQVGLGDKYLGENKFEDAVNAYCNAKELSINAIEIDSKLANAKKLAIENLNREKINESIPEIDSKRKEILKVLSVSSEIPYYEDVVALVGAFQQVDYMPLLSMSLEKTSLFEHPYKNQISDKSMNEAMALLDNLPPIEYLNTSFVLLLEGYFGEANLLRTTGMARLEYYSINLEDREMQNYYGWMEHGLQRHQELYHNYLVSIDEIIDIYKRSSQYLKKNDYDYISKKNNPSGYEKIISDFNNAIIQFESNHEQWNERYSGKKERFAGYTIDQIMERANPGERSNIEIPANNPAMVSANLVGNWYSTREIEYWIDTIRGESYYDNSGEEVYWEEVYWEEETDPTENPYGIKLGDRVQLISENFKESFPHENYEEEGYSEEEYMSEEFTGEEYSEEEFTEEEQTEEEYSDETRERINVQIIERKKSRSVVISNHPIDQYNGDYIAQDGLINNLPWYKNEHAQYLYFYDQAEGGSKSWSLDNRKPNGTKDWFNGGYTDPIEGLQHPQEGTHHWNSVPGEYETEESEEEYFEGYTEEFNGDNKFAWTKEKDKYKGQEGTVIEIDNYNESVKLLFDDATIFFVTYTAIGMDTEIDSESGDANWETEEYNEAMYEEYIEPTILQYIDTIFYSFNPNLSANLNKLPSTPNEPSFDEMEFQNINYSGWKSMNEFLKTLDNTKNSSSYNYSVINDGSHNCLSLSTNPTEKEERVVTYFDGEGFFDHNSCAESWLPTEKSDSYIRNSNYTIFLENENTLIIGKTYINNPNKFMPNTVISLKRL